MSKRENLWVSLKIMTADSSLGSRELHNLQFLEKCSQGGLSSKHIVPLLNYFTHQGPNGIHQCLVFELLGPSVDRVLGDIYSSGDTLEAENILRMSEQLLQAITYIHDAGMGHGGEAQSYLPFFNPASPHSSILFSHNGTYVAADINGGNVAFSCSHLSKVAKEDLFNVLGLPESEDLARLDGKPLDKSLPKHMIRATEWDEWIDEDVENLRVLDFGEAILQGNEPRALAQPGPLRVPETIFDECFDHRVDLWRSGCMVGFLVHTAESWMLKFAMKIYSFIFGTYPFQYLGDDDVLVAQMIGFVEELPKDWKPKWEHMRLSSKHQLESKERE